MGINYNPSAVTRGLLYNIDMRSPHSYPGSGTAVQDIVSNLTSNMVQPSYYTYNSSSGTISFTRTTAPAAKQGGGMICNTSGSLTYGNFLYNNNTWEVWFRIDDISAGGYDATEAYSVISVFPGYHSGFFVDPVYNIVSYIIWDYDGVTATQYIPCYWTLGTSGAQVNQGSWYQASVTKNGTTFTPYLNGVQQGTTQAVANHRFNNLAVSNQINVGKALDIASGAGSYNYYSKTTFSHMRLYNTILTGDEIAQNFRANRGRFGI